MNEEDRQKDIVRELPDITAAKQKETLRDFKDLLGYHNKKIFEMGLCDGHKCKWHKIVKGGHGKTCYCRRAARASESQVKRYWEKMHWENCSAGRSMEKNMGCKGYEPEGLPLYQQKKYGRKVI